MNRAFAVGSTVDGLVSGLDTTTIINQLMSLQAVPQTRLKTTLTATQSQLTGLQNINTGMSALAKATDALTKNPAWSPVSATSSSTDVTATAAAGAATGSTRFSVTSLASGQSSASTASYGSLTDTSAFAPGQTFEIRSGSGTMTPVSSANGSVQSLVDSINGANAGVRATAVRVSESQYRLQLTSATEGASSAFTVSGPGGDAATGLPLSTVTKPSDAVVHVGDADAGYDVRSSTNTIEGLLPGLTVKLTGVAKDVTVSTTTDDTTITASAKAMVDAANSVLGTLKAVTAGGTVNADGKRTGAGVLAGDSATKALAGQIISAVAGGSGGRSFAQIGIATTREGTLTFDAKVFAAALAKDPAATKAMFTNAVLGTAATDTPAVPAVAGTGIADLVNRLSAAASGTTGTISDAISGRNRTIGDLTTRISTWDTRLASQKAALGKQYSALETALGKLKNQSTWLAGQLSSLDANRSS